MVPAPMAAHNTKGPLAFFLRPFFRFFNKPSFRASPHFEALRDLFVRRPREEMLELATAFSAANQVIGDYLEFGVYTGNSFSLAYHFAQARGMDMTFYAFDSFEGLPDVRGVDAKGFRQFTKGEYSCSVEDFRNILAKKKVDLTKVHLIKGWYDQTLNAETRASIPLKKAAIIWIDCDLYESTVPVLNFITDLVQDGTIIIFDDWNAFRADPHRGERRAFSEWLAKNPSIFAEEFHRFSWHGNSFILRKTPKHL